MTCDSDLNICTDEDTEVPVGKVVCPSAHNVKSVCQQSTMSLFPGISGLKIAPLTLLVSVLGGKQNRKQILFANKSI